MSVAVGVRSTVALGMLMLLRPDPVGMLASLPVLFARSFVSLSAFALGVLAVVMLSPMQIVTVPAYEGPSVPYGVSTGTPPLSPPVVLPSSRRAR